MIKYLTIILLLFAPLLKAQKSLSFYSHGNLALSQVNGDGYGGYRKIGFDAGVGVLFDKENSSKKWALELNFIHKGSRQAPTDKNPQIDYKLYLGYIEVPALYVFPKYGVNWEVGPAVSFLLSSSEYNWGIPVESENAFKNIELSGVLGVALEISDRWNFRVRYSNSITPIRSAPVPDGVLWFRLGQYHSVISAGLRYHFSNPGFNWGYTKKKKTTVEP